MNKSAENIAGTGGDIGVVAGEGAGFIGKVIFKISFYISSLSLWDWFLIGFVTVGGFIVWHLKKKYKLEFRLFPKKPPKQYN